MIKNFELFHHLRTNRRGGEWRYFAASASVSTSLRGLRSCGSGSHLSATLAKQHLSYSVSCIIPRATTAQPLINPIIDPAARLVICRDFNRSSVSDILHQLHLTQVVDFPTHNQTSLDLIITDLAQQYSPHHPVDHCTHHIGVKVSFHQNLQAYARLCHEGVWPVAGATSVVRGDSSL